MKKIISIILILVMLFLPFSVLVNVKAEGITINTDANGKVTNNTGEIVVKDINAKKTEQGYDMTDSDTFKAYKVVDIYYDDQTREISYRFTSDFQRFLDDPAYASDNTVNGLTINDYLALTSDDSNNSGNANSSYVSTSSTLNILASKYATFIRKNEDGANPVVGLPMTNSYDDNSGNRKATLSNVVPGSYLILPSDVVARSKYSDGFTYMKMHTYGVMVANVFFRAVNDEWQLVNAEIYSKDSSIDSYDMLYPFSFEEAMNVDFESLTPEEQAILMANAGNRITASSGSTISITVDNNDLNIPTNTHTSIKDNNTIVQLLRNKKVSLPSGLTFDYDNLHYPESSHTITKNGNDFYLDDDELITSAIDQQNAISYMSVAFDILISNSHNFVAGANNTVNVKSYYLKDAYVDIGSNVTKDTVEAAFEKENTSEDTDQYKNIRKAIGVLNQELNVVLNGVRITNKDSNDNNLNGGVFQAYSDPNCTAGNEIGGPVTINNGVGSFVGINNYDTVYIKQITAPSGYKIYNNIIDLHPIATTSTPETGHEIQNATLGADSYYEINVVNQANVMLPFTGGIGTIIYVCLGIVVVIGAGIFLVIYKKKNKKENSK